MSQIDRDELLRYLDMREKQARHNVDAGIYVDATKDIMEFLSGRVTATQEIRDAIRSGEWRKEGE
jgi:hypothetical protein